MNGFPQRSVGNCDVGRLLEEFIREYVAETKRLKQQTASQHQVQERALLKVRKQIKAIIEAVKDGMRTPGMKEELEALEAEREKLEKQLANSSVAEKKIVDFHPSLPVIYRQKVEELQTSLKDETLRRGAMAILRTLIEKVVVTPTEAGVEVALYGELGALLELAEARKEGRPGGLEPRRSLSVVTGVGFTASLSLGVDTRPASRSSVRTAGSFTDPHLPKQQSPEEGALLLWLRGPATTFTEQLLGGREGAQLLDLLHPVGTPEPPAGAACSRGGATDSRLFQTC